MYAYNDAAAAALLREPATRLKCGLLGPVACSKTESSVRHTRFQVAMLRTSACTALNEL